MALPLPTSGAGPTARYASDGDIRLALGKLGNRLPAEIDVAVFGSMAHADLLGRLADTYPAGVPAFASSPDAVEAVRWAEARLAAAMILDVLRAAFDVGDTPGKLRESVRDTLDGGIVGFPPGSTEVSDGAGGLLVVSGSVPLASSNAPNSLFVDPYEDLRDPDAFPYL